MTVSSCTNGGTIDLCDCGLPKFLSRIHRHQYDFAYQNGGSQPESCGSVTGQERGLYPSVNAL